MATLDDSGVAAADVPTTVPASFYAQAQGDMLNQQAAADTATNNFQAQMLSDHVNNLGQIASIQQLDQAMQPVRKASQYIGSDAWGSGHNTYCETFAEQMTDGKNMGASATDAFQNRLKSGQAVADPTLQGVSPGDLVYFGGAQENGGYGHVGVYAGDGRIVSATVNGIQSSPISAFNAPVSGYAKTGGGTGGMGVVGENTGGGSGTDMAAPHDNKIEGGDNPPPPQASGDSWAPPSADALKNWFGSQVSKIFSAPANAGDIAGQQMSQIGNKASEVAGDIGNTASQIGTDIHDAPGPLGQLTSAAGDVADTLHLQPGQSPLDAAITPIQALGKIGNDLNPANIGSTLASDVGATTPMPSIPVLSGAANVAGSLVAPGGILPEAGALSDAATQGTAALGQMLPKEMGGAALSNVALGRMGINPIAGAAEDAGQGAGKLGNNINPAHVPDDVALLVNKNYQDDATAIDAARRGVIPDAQAVRNARNVDVSSVVDAWKPGGAVNQETAIAIRNAWADSLRTAEDARQAALANPTAENQMAQLQAESDAKGMGLVAHGMTAEAGRTLRALGIDVTDPLVLRAMARDGVDDFISKVQAAQTQSVPGASPMLPGFEPPALGSDVQLSLSGKPTSIDELPSQLGVGLDPEALGDQLNAGRAYPVFQSKAPDTGPSGMGLDIPLIKKAGTLQEMAKQVLVSLSIFHPLVEEAQLGRTFLGQGKPIQGISAMARTAHAFVSPKFLDSYLQANKWPARWAEVASVTGLRGDTNPDVGHIGSRIVQSALGAAGTGLSSYAEAKTTGASDSDALTRGLIGAGFGAAAGIISPSISKALWGRLVPVAKLEAFKVLKNKYGAEAAATSVNNIFGGQNLAKLGRTRQVQDVARLALLAPDWLESWARNAGATVGIGVEHGIKGPEAQAARAYWAATLISGAVTLEGLNVAFNGHTTDHNEPGHRFELETTGLLQKLGQPTTQRTYLDINSLGPLGSALNAVDRGVMNGDPLGTPGAFLNSHLNIGPGAALAGIKDVNYFGKQIVPRGTPFQDALLPEAGAIGQRITPIGAGSFHGQGVPAGQQVFSGVTGMRSSAGGFTAPGGSSRFRPGTYQPFTPRPGNYAVRGYRVR